MSMLVWLTLPFYNFCGFRSVAVNSVYKLQFFTFIVYKRRYLNTLPFLFSFPHAGLAIHLVLIVPLTISSIANFNSSNS